MKAFEWLESGALFRPVCVHFRLLVAAKRRSSCSVVLQVWKNYNTKLSYVEQCVGTTFPQSSEGRGWMIFFGCCCSQCTLSKLKIHEGGRNEKSLDPTDV